MGPTGTHLATLVFCAEALSKTHISGFRTYWNPLEPTLEPIVEMTTVSRKTLHFRNMGVLEPILEPICFPENLKQNANFH